MDATTEYCAVADVGDIEQIRQRGYAVKREVFQAQEILVINSRIRDYLTQPHPGIVYETDDSTVRGIHGPHLYDGFFDSLIRDPRLLSVAEDLLGEPCYVHQMKINMKQRMRGESWPWHQDFIYWHRGDGIPLPRMLNASMMLNDVDMLQGPLCYIPGSHLHGDLSVEPSSADDWTRDLSKDLTYQIGHDTIDALFRSEAAEYMIGKAGDMLFFDPLLAHCSSTNLSPYDRMLLIVTYNTVANVPKPGHPLQRPEFLCNRDHRPLAALQDSKYLEARGMDL
jgi:ectoine hydroxylase